MNSRWKTLCHNPMVNSISTLDFDLKPCFVNVPWDQAKCALWGLSMEHKTKRAVLKCASSSTDPRPATGWPLHHCLWAETHSFPPLAPGTQTHLTQGSHVNLHRYNNGPATLKRDSFTNAVKHPTVGFMSIHSFSPLQRQKGPSSRAHSAVNDEAGRSAPRDRHHLLDVFSRPNTTHTYRVRCCLITTQRTATFRPRREAVMFFYSSPDIRCRVAPCHNGISNSRLLAGVVNAMRCTIS